MYKNMYMEPSKKKTPVTRNQQPLRQSSANVPERPSKICETDFLENSQTDSSMARRKRSERQRGKTPTGTALVSITMPCPDSATPAKETLAQMTPQTRFEPSLMFEGVNSMDDFANMLLAKHNKSMATSSDVTSTQ